jgi:hypothetical protein
MHKNARIWYATDHLYRCTVSTRCVFMESVNLEYFQGVAERIKCVSHNPCDLKKPSYEQSKQSA